MGKITININTGGSSSPKEQLKKWTCPYCKGTGKIDSVLWGDKKCPACHGRKGFSVKVDAKHKLFVCGECGGDGQVETITSDTEICDRCKGKGKILKIK